MKTVSKKIAPSLIRQAYRRLYQRFGPQGWWPTTPSHSFVPQYSPRKSFCSMNHQQQFEICLGAILTQNTNWGNVVKVLSLLKKNESLSLDRLIDIPLPRLQKYFRSSGYFRQKAIRVRNFLKTVRRENGSREFGNYFLGELKTVREKLLSVHGIGPETADSMLLYAAGQPIFVVDAYTRRIGQRWGILKENMSYAAIQEIFMEALPSSAPVFGEYHALLVRLAKDFCRTKPECKKCPVRKLCRTGQEDF